MIEKFTYKGNWFLPENAEKKVNGILSFDPEEGANLELFDTLVDFNKSLSYKSQSFILGVTTNNKLITLYNSFEYNRSLSSGKQTCKYISNFVLIGDHYTSEDEFTFNKIKGRFKNLDEWLSIYGFKEVEPNFKNHSLKVDYELPEYIKIEIFNNLHIIFNFTYSSPIHPYTHKLVIEQKSEVVFDSNVPVPFYDILENIMLFQNFLTLGTFEPANLIYVFLYNNDRKENVGGQSKPIQTQLFHNPGFKYVEGRIKNKSEFLFNYNDIRQNFGDIIKKWFELNELLKPVTYLLFDSFYHRKKFTENRFLNIIQAIETFHRRFRKNVSISKKEHKVRINNILASIDIKHRDWLNEKLNFSNEPTLHQRLSELIEEIPIQTIKKIIVDQDQFIRRIKHNRNYYTHYDKSLESKALKGNELYKLSEKLRVILIVLILKEIGFSLEQAEILLDRNESNFFNHIIE